MVNPGQKHDVKIIFFSFLVSPLCKLASLSPILDSRLHTAGGDEEHKKNIDIFIMTQECKGSKNTIPVLLSRKVQGEIRVAMFVHVPISNPVAGLREDRFFCLTEFGSFAYLMD